MGTQTQIPDEVPVVDVDDETFEAIERFHRNYRSDYGAGASAIIHGNYHSQEEKASGASAKGGKRIRQVTLSSGQPIDFSDAYRTSTKHTYYAGIHVRGYRLTAEYHDGSGGGFYALRVKPEEAV